MSDNGKKKQGDKGNRNYVKTFRHGAIAANVFQRVAAGGFEYLDFSLSRAWKTSTKKEGYSQQFFAKNRNALHAAIDEACDFIEKDHEKLNEEPAEQVETESLAT